LVNVAVQLVIVAMHSQLGAEAVKSTLISSPLIFLGTIMLTEPATMPSRNHQRLLFAALVAVLAATGWKVGPIYIDPEIALLFGNLYAFAVSPKFRSRLKLTEIHKISGNVYDYVFKPDRRFAFLPGQYMEWTLPHVRYDSRGNRRTFTIASSPTEDELHLGVKFYKQSSAYKAALYRMKPGDYIYASELAGNFTVDWRSGEKLAFIAGGVGITPFRSQIKYALDKGLERDIVLIYAVSDAKELAYQGIFREAAKLGVRYEPVVGGVLDTDTLSQLIPDYAERTCYVSGPNRMVDVAGANLRALGVKQVVTDHFSGY
jgi:ferredoxin-NADP reductase